MSEHQQREYKLIWKDDYLKVVCAFANAEGGVLEIGRADDGTPVGVERVAKLLEDIPNKIRDVLGVVADVGLIKEKRVQLIRIGIDPYLNPISYKGEYFYRSGSTVQALKGAALERFLLRKRGRHWDGVPLPGFGLQDCSPEAFEHFRQRAAKSGRMDKTVLDDTERSLVENLQLTEKEWLRQAAVMLFAQNPDRFIPGAYVKIGFFVTDDDLRYQDEIHGNLFMQIDKVMDLLQTKYMKAYIRYEGLQRVEEFLFPPAALREALLNALAHKDYGSGIPIQISVYEDRIVIWNAGVLPDNWTIEFLMRKHPSCPFNPLIANTLFRAGHIESWGRGIEKIERECRKHGIEPPDYNYQMSGLMIIFKAEIPAAAQDAGKSPQGVAGEPSVKTSVKTSVKILELLRENPGMTLAQIAESVGKTVRAVEMAASKLVKEGHLRFVGPQKGGHWEVLK